MFPQIFGKYVLEREIAAGGMARVYLATLRGAVGFEKRLVVKQIRTELASDEAFVTRFVEEAKTAVELSHPNIVPVYELGVEQGVYYIAMELCEGLTLSEVLAETGPLGPAEGAYVGAEICRALDYAHRRVNIVHRDVTPRNVLIDDEGAVRLIDFGIAAPVTGATNTARPEVFGSPGHMPPEQLHGAELTPATDVFAVGVLLIEAWTGYPPFRRATAQESEHALFKAPPPIDRHLAPLAPLSALIARSVALDARERPSGAEHLARPLRDFLKSEDSGDIARRLGDRVRRARRRARASSPWLTGEPATDGREGTRPFRAGSPGREQNTAALAGEPVTRTFAARDDLELWTRKLSSASAPPGAMPHTPNAPIADASGEAPGLLSGRVSRGERGAGRWALGAVAVASLAFVSLAFAFASRVNLPALQPRAPTDVGPIPLARPVRVVLPAASETPVVAAPAAVQSSRPASRKAAESAPIRTAVPGASAGPEPVGALKITADPRATVEVSGAHFQQFGQTPLVGLKVPVGRYQIVFRNDTFGAPLSAQVMVVAGATRSVHADFRQAEPAISVR